jgi:hypothetical protein
MSQTSLSNKVSNQLQETYKNKCKFFAILLVFMSLIFFLTMLFGSAVGSVDLNKFTFDEPISTVLQRKSIKFTLLGYCIDDKCTNHVSHDFDKAPTSDEIKSGEVKKRSIDADIDDPKYNHIDINPSEAADKAGDIANDAGDAAKNAGEKAGEIANDAGEKAKEAAENAKDFAVNALLDAFDNFTPKESTNGKSGWIARPIIAASIFNTLTLFLLLIINDDNRKYCYPSAIILLLVSFILNIASFFTTFSLFTLVFNVIGAFPGIGDNRTGAAIYLSGWSSAFLLIALILMLIDGSREQVKKFKSDVSDV